MALKVASQEAMQRLFKFAGDKTITPPPKVVEHKERIAAWERMLEKNWEELGGVYQDQLDLVVKLKRRLDGMYIEWAEGEERTRWCDLPTKPDLCVDDIIREAVYNTEAIYGATGVEVLARYLEMFGYDGVFKGLVERYLLEIRPLLEEAVPFEGEAAEALTNPKAFFNTEDEDEVRRLITDHFSDKIDKQSPEHVKRAMTAHIEFGLGNYVGAIKDAEFAHHEKHVPNFGRELHRPGAGAAQAELLAVERRKAQILIELLGR